MDVATAALTEAGGDMQLGLRGRAVISRQQRQLLEAVYARNPRPSTAELDRVADQLTAVPRRVVRVWFQNKRARDRRRGRRSPSQSSAGTPVSATVYLLTYLLHGNIIVCGARLCYFLGRLLRVDLIKLVSNVRPSVHKTFLRFQ